MEGKLVLTPLVIQSVHSPCVPRWHYWVMKPWYHLQGSSWRRGLRCARQLMTSRGTSMLFYAEPNERPVDLDVWFSQCLLFTLEKAHPPGSHIHFGRFHWAPHITWALEGITHSRTLSACFTVLHDSNHVLCTWAQNDVKDTSPEYKAFRPSSRTSHILWTRHLRFLSLLKMKEPMTAFSPGPIAQLREEISWLIH